MKVLIAIVMSLSVGQWAFGTSDSQTVTATVADADVTGCSTPVIAGSLTVGSGATNTQVCTMADAGSSDSSTITFVSSDKGTLTTLFQSSADIASADADGYNQTITATGSDWDTLNFDAGATQSDTYTCTCLEAE